MSQFQTLALVILLCVPSLQAQDSDTPTDKTPGLNASLVSALNLRGIGPAFMSGRIVDIAVDPVGPEHVVHRGRIGWRLEDHQLRHDVEHRSSTATGSYSIGCVTVDPNNRHMVWVGTGENNSQRSVGYGDGVYKSLDGGQSFARVGLGTRSTLAGS